MKLLKRTTGTTGPERDRETILVRVVGEHDDSSLFERGGGPVALTRDIRAVDFFAHQRQAVPRSRRPCRRVSAGWGGWLGGRGEAARVRVRVRV